MISIIIIKSKKKKMFKFTQVTVCKNTTADNIDYANPSQVRKSVVGDLQIMLETTTGMVLFRMKDFEYGVNPNDQILYDDQDAKNKFMLCLDANPSNTWILKINDNVEMAYFILNQRCRLINKRASRMIVDSALAANQGAMTYPELENIQQPKQTKQTKQIKQIKQTKQQTPESGLLNASKTFSRLLISLGSYLAKGIQTIGQFLSKKVQTNPSEHMKISPIIKFLIDKSFGASKKILEFNTDKATKLFRFTANQVIGLTQKIQNTDAGKKLKQNGTIDSAKDNLKVGLQAITHIYDGFAEGYDQVTKGISKGANQVISARYGQDAGNAALKIAEGYRNVGKMTNVANQALKRVLVQTAKNQITKQQKNTK